jgi:hypothetical protein
VFEYESKTKTRAWTEEHQQRGPEAFRPTDEYQRNIHHSLDIHNVIHKEFVSDGKTVKHESYVHELQNL